MLDAHPGAERIVRYLPARRALARCATSPSSRARDGDATAVPRDPDREPMTCVRARGGPDAGMRADADGALRSIDRPSEARHVACSGRSRPTMHGRRTRRRRASRPGSSPCDRRSARPHPLALAATGRATSRRSGGPSGRPTPLLAKGATAHDVAALALIAASTARAVVPGCDRGRLEHARSSTAVLRPNADCEPTPGAGLLAPSACETRSRHSPRRRRRTTRWSHGRDAALRGSRSLSRAASARHAPGVSRRRSTSHPAPGCSMRSRRLAVLGTERVRRCMPPDGRSTACTVARTPVDCLRSRSRPRRVSPSASSISPAAMASAYLRMSGPGS